MGYMFQREPQTCQKLRKSDHVMHDVSFRCSSCSTARNRLLDGLPIRGSCTASSSTTNYIVYCASNYEVDNQITTPT